MASGESVGRRLRGLFGEEPLGSARVLHVAAVWRAPDGTLRVIRIGPRSPRSETDQFVLRAARMRADAIVTTGKILRDEPGLRHDEFDPELLAWRRDTRGKALPPRSVILSSGLSIEFQRPLPGEQPEPLLVVPEANAARVEAAARSAGASVEVVGRKQASLRDTLTLLDERGVGCALVEAGPSTTRELYTDPAAVDELWLSVFEEAELHDDCVGEGFADEARLRALFDGASPPVECVEASGRWTFQRFWRSAG